MIEYDHTVPVNIPLNSIIKYGVKDNYIDITQICLEKCRYGDRIIIPICDVVRASILGDPLPYVLKTIFVEIPPIYGLYFISCIGNYLNIVNEQLEILVNSDLYKETRNILLFICSYDNNIKLNYIINKYDIDKKCIVVTNHENAYEKFAINNYKSYIKDDVYYLYYFHTKGVTRQQPIFHNRRKILNFYTLKKYKLNLKLLQNYDAIGCSLTQSPKLHFSGNFWWSKSEHLNTLPITIGDEYLDPEMYICSNPNSRYISLSQTTNEGRLIKEMKRSDKEILNAITSNKL